MLLDFGSEFGDGSGKIGSEGTVDVGFELGEVLSLATPSPNAHNLDSLVVLAVLVRLEVVVEFLSIFGNVGSVGSLEVTAHSLVVREERGGSTDFGTHVANGGHTRAREVLDTWTVVLNDGTGTTFDSKDTSDLEDDIWNVSSDFGCAHPLEWSIRSSFRQGRHR